MLITLGGMLVTSGGILITLEGMLIHLGGMLMSPRWHVSPPGGMLIYSRVDLHAP